MFTLAKPTMLSSWTDLLFCCNFFVVLKIIQYNFLHEVSKNKSSHVSIGIINLHNNRLIVILINMKLKLFWLSYISYNLHLYIALRPLCRLTKENTLPQNLSNNVSLSLWISLKYKKSWKGLTKSLALYFSLPFYTTQWILLLRDAP